MQTIRGQEDLHVAEPPTKHHRKLFFTSQETAQGQNKLTETKAN